MNKKWQSAKTRHMAVAEGRLVDWRLRGRRDGAFNDERGTPARVAAIRATLGI